MAKHSKEIDEGGLQEEYDKLSEVRKIEYFRRLNDADDEAVGICLERRALHDVELQLNMKGGNDGNRNKRILVLLLIFCAVILFLPGLFSTNSVGLLILLAWVIFAVVTANVVIPRLVFEKNEHQIRLTQHIARWRRATGIHLGEKETEIIETDYMGGLHPESERHYRRIRHNVLVDLRNLDYRV